MMIYPPGVVGIATGKIGRYRTFDKCLYQTEMPIGTHVDWQEGVHIATNYNNMIETMLGSEGYRWLWILGDDHVWQPHILQGLLSRDVDCVIPLCLHKQMPFMPVLHGDKAGGYQTLDFEFLAGKTGLVELHGEVPGNAGLLVKRHVLEKIDPPWFEDGQTNPEMGGCDLWFLQKIYDLGLKVHLDLDYTIGHLKYAAVWPERREDGMYEPVIKDASHTYVEATC